MYQKYQIIGRLPQDCQQRYTQGGDSVVNFRVLTSKKVKDKEYTFGIDATLWGKLGESLAKYLTKGQLVFVEGELRQESWEKDGQKHYKTVLSVDTVRLLGGKQDNITQKPQQSPQQSASAPTSNDPFEIDF